MTSEFSWRQFPVLLEEDETGGYVVSCPVFDGCYSQGETVDEALKNIKEAIELCLEEAQERGEMPQKMPRVGVHFVHVA